jgi:hypothetical protein
VEAVRFWSGAWYVPCVSREVLAGRWARQGSAKAKAPSQPRGTPMDSMGQVGAATRGVLSRIGSAWVYGQAS